MIKKKYRKIPQKFIHELIERTDIIELINKYITLKKSGNNYKSLCPFHNEKTPSFVVSPQKQFFYCFGCGIHGNVIDFLMKYEKLNFLNSIIELTTLNGINISYLQNQCESLQTHSYKRRIHYILYKVSKIYIKNLFKLPNIAYQYLIKRGINASTIKKFSLGFATSYSNQITRYIQKKHIYKSIIMDCGITIQDKKKNLCDRFKERIIFPIKNKHGHIQGFGARVLNEYNYPKYLNSPETMTFQKKKNLYGIYELNRYNPKPKKILVVEGYLDVISLAQFNINYSIALLGTTVTKYQLQLLFKISKHIIFCFDGDYAGEKASWIALNLSLNFLYDNYTINFMLLPKNEDPSSLIVKDGKKKFENRIKNSETLYSYLFKNVSSNMNLSCINDCIKLSQITIPLIKKIPSQTIKIFLRKLLGNKIGILDSHQLKKLITISYQKKNQKIYKPFKITTMRLLISLILQHPELALTIQKTEKIKKFNIIGKKILIKLIQLICKKKILTTGHLLEFYRHTPLEKIFKHLSTWDHIVKKNKLQSLVQELVHNLKIQHLEYQYNQLITLERQYGLNLIEKNKLWHINKKIMKIKYSKYSSNKEKSN
ncbi:DNA primase [Buchnera aphidicola (Cinara pseudotaxifoliae)]|uniref:DNA primase n=1 Tax=Buchnera aphidicola (Cinara pseudotaxifoliae) TaxID=655384 RepID=A0A451DG47_9GAMM|nr:DNA primase [Buchnera aphidicola]VFP85600.1 DNA primase [Buchnera aphidicola (Cinara pseudotaxifoliae)]